MMNDRLTSKVLSFLFEKNTRDWIEDLSVSGKSVLTMSVMPEVKKLSLQFRQALLSQVQLQPQIRSKFPSLKGLIFTSLSLQQATSEPLARYKSNILAEHGNLADLCCGGGADSLYYPGKAMGIDWELQMAHLYRHNMSMAGKKARVILGDVTNCHPKVRVAQIDPSRRKLNEGRWKWENLSPSLNELFAIKKQFTLLYLKLGPGMPIPEPIRRESSVDYLGTGDNCLEAWVRWGEGGESGVVRAVEVRSGCNLQLPEREIQGAFPPIKSPGSFLFEPLKMVVRAHLHGYLAQILGLWPMDEKVSYLSGDTLIRHSLLKSYRIIGELPWSLKKMRQFLNKKAIGEIEIKKRGMDLNIEEVRKYLDLKGEEKGTLIFCRVNNQKKAYLVEAQVS